MTKVACIRANELHKKAHNKKNPVARIVFDGLMITGLSNIPFNSAVADAPIITCDATFQFTSYEIKDP